MFFVLFNEIVDSENPNIIHIGKKYIVELAAIADGINAVIERNKDSLKYLISLMVLEREMIYNFIIINT